MRPSPSKLRFGRRVNEPDDVGMNLTQRHQRRELGAGSPRGFPPRAAPTEFTQERSTVALDRSFGVVLGESQVQRVAAIYTRKSSQARGEPVNEPRKLAQVRGPKNVEFAWLGNPVRHLPMLPVSPALPHFSQKLFLIRSDLPNEWLIAGVFMRGCPKHHFRKHRGQIDSFRRQQVN